MSKASSPPAATPSLQALKLRVLLTRAQTSRAATWLSVCHQFRNASVAFLRERRRHRWAWVKKHPGYAPDDMPKEFIGDGSKQLSKWLTQKLELAREAAAQEFRLPSGKLQVSEAFAACWSQLSRGEKAEVRERFEARGIYLTWLLVPRTCLDQLVGDIKKTTNKAIKDRVEKIPGKRKAGFPTFRKFRFTSGFRLQVEANKNNVYRTAWAAGEVVLPGLGRIRIRESGYAFPKTPAKLITLARDAAGRWHVTFVCAPGEALGARARRLVVMGKTFEALPVDASGLPTIEGFDASLISFGVSNVHGALGRERHQKKYAKRVRKANKRVSRRQKGSGRWKRAVRQLGKLHVRVANVRQAHIRLHAQTIARRSAVVCLEDLSLGFMLRNRKLSKSAYDLAWGSFKTELARECEKRGHLLLLAGRFDATTQTCPNPKCSYVNKALKNNLKLRAWDCPECGNHHDRDIAAAHNIQAMALTRYVALESLSGEERIPGMSKLHPELSAFITRGGMTALAQANAWPGSRQLSEARLSNDVPENRGPCSSSLNRDGTGETD